MLPSYCHIFMIVVVASCLIDYHIFIIMFIFCTVPLTVMKYTVEYRVMLRVDVTGLEEAILEWSGRNVLLKEPVM